MSPLHRDRYRSVLQKKYSKDEPFCRPSVSYTHLDVYKRQDSGSFEIGAEMAGNVYYGAAGSGRKLKHAREFRGHEKAGQSFPRGSGDDSFCFERRTWMEPRLSGKGNGYHSTDDQRRKRRR